MNEQEKHIRRMKNPTYASGYHLGFADGFKQGEDSIQKQYETMVIDGYENEIKLLKNVIEQQKIDKPELQRDLSYEQIIKEEVLDGLFKEIMKHSKEVSDQTSPYHLIDVDELFTVFEKYKKETLK